MKRQLGLLPLFALAAVWLCSCKPAAEPTRSDTKANTEQVQQLVKERDEARSKAEAAVQRMRDNGSGAQLDALGFANAKSVRDQQAASGSKVEAYDRYAKTAREIERRVQGEVLRGAQSPATADVARFERLQAEVDLAQIKGELPADAK